MLTENIQNRKLTKATEEFQGRCTLVWGGTNCLATQAMTSQHQLWRQEWWSKGGP